jgi:Flp pilus assembly protein TadG
MPTTHRRARRTSEQGTVAIEFVLVAPILLVLVFGMVEFGRAYNAKVELTAAVREGARALALGSDDPVTATTDAAPGLDPTTLVVTTSSTPCTAGDPATVTASYPFTLHIPFWGTPTVDLQAEGVMRCGG